MHHRQFENDVQQRLTWPVPGPLHGLLADGSDGAGTNDARRRSRAVHLAEHVRTVLQLPDNIAVTVQQLTCREPGCPPIETAIAVLASPPRRWNLHQPLLDITDEVVTRLITEHPTGGRHDDH